VDGKDALLELMAEELAALKRQIAELRRPEQSERRPEQPEQPEQKPEQGSRASSLVAQAGTGARNVSAQVFSNLRRPQTQPTIRQ